MQKWLAVVVNLLPMILAFIPGMPAMLVPVIIQGINEAEQMKGASGPDKKQHVLSLVNLAIATTNATAKRTVIDGAKAMLVIDHAIDTGIAIVNLLSPKPH
jgi:hypothetical protein